MLTIAISCMPRAHLLRSVAHVIGDYRSEELPEPTPGHVDRWARQFRKDAQIPLLKELVYTLGYAYFSKIRVISALARLVEFRGLVGGAPRKFWRTAHVFDIQQEGNSQSDFRELLLNVVECRFGVPIGGVVAGNGTFIYLDDAIFSGGRVYSDLSKWVAQKAPASATVHVVVILAHCYGRWKCKKDLERMARTEGKSIRFFIWAAKLIENRVAYRDDSEVLWPTEVPEDAMLIEYMEQEKTRYPFKKRSPGGRLI